MKYIIILSILTLSLYGSMGNCLDCHKKLAKNIDKDKNHLAMKSCIECHSASTKNYLECGEKCFSCHSQDDLEPQKIPQHKVFEECRECHEVKTKHLFTPDTSFEQSHNDSLKDFLF
ncbi:MAG: hypothetical protein GXO30_04680 [Epsilonproteobacteria bacterium]|nr:hypothetical protein [Campylobacterota bacterium]